MKKNVIRGVKAAILDLDGTLFDSTHLWAQIDIDFLKKRGLEPTDEYRRALGALGNREAAYFTIEYYGLKDTPEELMREWAGMARHEYENNIKLFDGAKEYLLGMHERGITLVAVTSLARELALAGLKSNGIYDLFKVIITADESNLSKTSPDIYIHAAEVVGVSPSECVAFDDVAKALQSARIAGMKTVAVRGEGVHDCGEGAADYTVWNIADAPLLIID
ncbi:MAG: HAD family phosphatase [Clostridiales bacterium]|nr:HAD family phosphatase [Clostridiales bacterium]